MAAGEVDAGNLQVTAVQVTLVQRDGAVYGYLLEAATPHAVVDAGADVNSSNSVRLGVMGDAGGNPIMGDGGALEQGCAYGGGGGGQVAADEDGAYVFAGLRGGAAVVYDEGEVLRQVIIASPLVQLFPLVRAHEPVKLLLRVGGVAGFHQAPAPAGRG